MEAGKKIILLGATGFTGKLVASALNNDSIRFSIAGRSLDKLTLLKEKNQFAEAIELIDVTGNVNLIDKYDLVINCVGPFNLWGKTVLDLCIEQGKTYIDICGEQKFVKRSFDNNSEILKKGATIIHSVSFESCLADMLIADNYNPSAVYENISTYYYFERTRPSPGTRLTMQLSHLFPTYCLQDSELLEKPLHAYQENVSFSILPNMNTAVFMPYPEVIFLKNKKNVKNGSSFLLMTKMDTLLFSGSKPGNNLSIETILTNHSRANLKEQSEEERSNQKFILIAKFITDSGKTVNTSISGTDMYGITAQVVSGLVRRIVKGAIIPEGVITPSEAFGNDWNWNWLNKKEFI